MSSNSETYRRYQSDELETLLLGKVSKIKDISLNLGNEIKSSNGLINGLNDDFEKNNSFIRKLLINLNKLPKFSDCKLYFIILLFALFVFTVLIFLFKFK
jgi:hypothetical protein